MTTALKLFQGRFGRVALLDSDQNLVTHAHPQCHVLIKADGEDTSFDVGGQRYPLTRETMVLVNAWETHAKVHRAGGRAETGAAGRSTVLALYIEPQWLAAADGSLSVAGLQGFFPSPCVRIPAPVRALADRLVAGMFESAPGSDRVDARLEAALHELMMSVIWTFSAWRERGAIHRASLRRLSDPRINRAIRFMRENLDTALSFDRIAAQSNLSRPHFFHLFRQCTSVPPAVYLSTLRMESAFGRIARPGTTINALAADLGFSEPQHFTRFFRQNLGIPPSEYRRTVELFD